MTAHQIDIRRRRARAQLLHRPPGLCPTAIVGHLLAVQAQDARSPRLALRARSRGLLATDVERDLFPARDLVVGWLVRGTLHMVCVEDYPWLLALTSPGRLAASHRRLAEEGLTPRQVERGVEVIERALSADGPLTRSQLADRVDVEQIRASGQAIVHLIIISSLRGVAIPASTDGGHDRIALTDDWLGHRPTADLLGEDRDTALAELVRRYLRAHAPARESDIARWAGLGLRDIRRGLARIAGELAAHPQGCLALRSEALTDAPLRPVLLPAFDPYMLGWADRSFAVAPEHARRVHPGGGTLRAVACRDGLAIGTWTARRRAGGLRLALDPFADLPPCIEPALAAEAEQIARFEGLDLVR